MFIMIAVIAIIAIVTFNFFGLPVGASTEGREIVFIDSAVKDSSFLADAARPGVEVVYLDADRDGIDQISDVLSNQRGLTAIHVVSHGAQGKLLLGTDVLSSENLEKYDEQLKKIGNSLSKGGNILLYGCNVAKGEEGATFIKKLAQTTGASVAASTDLTGPVSSNGNWILEAHTGPIYATTVFDPRVINNYPYTLSVTTTINGTLTTTNTFYRPYSPADLSCDGYDQVFSASDMTSQTDSLFNYFTRTLTPGVTGDYTFDATSADFTGSESDPTDTYVLIYDGAFDPASPLTNLYKANDDSPGGSLLSYLPNISLIAGQTYTLVLTSFGAGAYGPLSMDITGPGAVTVSTNQYSSDAVTISGSVGVSGVGATLSYNDGASETAIADGSGNYSLTVPTGWSGTVTPSLAGDTFTPPNMTYSNVTVNQTSQDYTVAGSTSAPTVTTQEVTSISDTTATGNGNITSLGTPNPTEYGVVWSTSTSPTVALSTITTQGAIDATGAFTSSITGLTANTTYYVRAYA